MSTATVVSIDGLMLVRGDEGEFRVRDTDLAERLGYERPRVIRDLIERLIKEGELPAIDVRRTVRRTSMPNGGHKEVAINEYHLDRVEALIVTMQSNAPKAKEMRRFIAEVFVRAVEQWEADKATPIIAIPDDTPSQSCVMQARIGDDMRLRDCLKSLCSAAASTSGRSVQSIHGELRKPWGVASIYRIALTSYQHTVFVLNQIIDDALGIKRLPRHKRQLDMPWRETH